MYVLRQYKLSILYKKTLDGVELNRNEKKFLSLWMGRQLDGRSGLSFELAYKHITNFESFISEFQHYQEMNIPAITNTELVFQSPADLFSNFSDLEHAWIEKQKRIMHVNPYDENELSEIIYEKDGLYVFNTHTFYSPEEAKAMGHCGNQYGDESQRLLSVRSKLDDEGKVWKPHATIILNDCIFNRDGTIKSSRTGEIKGFANEAPKEKYHDFIGEFFLASPYIKGMDGGGYLPESNLQFTDFSKELQTNLLEDEPNFIRSIEKLIIAEGKVTPELVQQFKYDYGLEDKFVIREFDNLKEYAETFDLSDLEQYSEEDAFFDMYFDAGSSECEDLLEEVFDKHPDVIGKIQAWAIENGFEESSYELDSSGIASWAQEGYNELHNALSNSVSDGYRYGTEAEAYKAMDACLNAHRETTGFEITDEDGYHGKIIMKTSAEDAINSIFSIIKDQCGGSICKDKPLADAASNSDLYNSLLGGELMSGELEDMIIDSLVEEQTLKDMDVPYYGFNDYDLNGARDRLVEALYEDLDISVEKTIEEPKLESEPQSSFMNAYYEEQAKVEAEEKLQTEAQPSVTQEVKQTQKIYIPKP